VEDRARCQYHWQRRASRLERPLLNISLYSTPFVDPAQENQAAAAEPPECQDGHARRRAPASVTRIGRAVGAHPARRTYVTSFRLGHPPSAGGGLERVSCVVERFRACIA
jgi:hypothetical protein